MTRPEDDTDPRNGLPDGLLEAIEQSDDRQLREIIHHAQAILHQRHDPTMALEAREGEEILHTSDHGAYTIAIVRRTDATGPEQGPYVYRVRYEPELHDEEGRFRWHYLGRVDE